MLASLSIIPAASAHATVYRGVAVPPGGRHAWVSSYDSVVVYHTSDFGVTWHEQELASTRRIYDVFFLDTLRGWTCGHIGAIFHTTDGGVTWLRQNLGGPYHALRVTMSDDTAGWACGDCGILMKTDCGGVWNPVFLAYELGLADDSVCLRDIGCAGGDTAWLVAGEPFNDYPPIQYPGGQGYVFRSSNDGDSWALVSRDTTLDFYGVTVFSGNALCIVGGDDRNGRGLVMTTSDGGTDWRIAAVVPGILRAVKFVDRQHGWACGDSGTIIVTNDGGQTWTRQPTPVYSTLYDIDFADRYRGMASGDGTVLITTDGGLDWHRWTRIGIHASGQAPDPEVPEFRTLVTVKNGQPRFVIAGVHGDFRLAVVDVLGRIANSYVGVSSGTTFATMPDERHPLASGVYIAVLTAPGARLSRRFVVAGR